LGASGGAAGRLIESVALPDGVPDGEPDGEPGGELGGIWPAAPGGPPSMGGVPLGVSPPGAPAAVETTAGDATTGVSSA